jgi:uncharacterized protein YraI
MNWNKFLLITALILIVLASACSLPGGAPAPAAANTSAPATAVPVDAQVAQMVAQTLAAQTVAANNVAASPNAQPTNTPEFTFTPSLTPTMTFTDTPAVPMVSVSVNTNCRSGPGDPYAILGVLMVGQPAEVVGRTPYTDTLIIKLPPNGTLCWMSLLYATVNGDITKLPVATIPASPTPVGSFKAVYSSTQTCSPGWGIKLQITNNGDTTWESNRVQATDQSTSESHTAQYDTFPNYNSANCSLISAGDLSLAPGATGTTSVFGFSANPAGHTFTAIVRVCSQNGLAGICVDKTITFTP